MRLVLTAFGYEIVRLDISIPRISLFAPDTIPDSIEYAETWLNDDEEE